MLLVVRTASVRPLEYYPLAAILRKSVGYTVRIGSLEIRRGGARRKREHGKHTKADSEGEKTAVEHGSPPPPHFASEPMRCATPAVTLCGSKHISVAPDAPPPIVSTT